MLYKRMQSMTNSVTIASGCSTTWKTRVLRQLEFDHSMSTEDFSLTMQVHRKRLGLIKYVSSAVVWTQDPFSVQSYRKQMYRWDRAWWESVRKYRVGLHWLRMKGAVPVGLSVLDVSTLLLTFDIFMFMAAVLLLPLAVIFPVEVNLRLLTLHSRADALIVIGWQYASVIGSALVVACLTRRPRILLYSPLFLFLMYVDILTSLQALVSTMRGQYRKVKAPTGAAEATASIWKSPERREVA
jgi:cellulose synthase/poly-beta-1,6-N-acetylglucosamine synthase-like glycosyltransferase